MAIDSASSDVRRPEGLHRHLVEPLCVVDDAQQRAVIGGGRHQAQHGQPDQETVGRRADSRPKRRSARHAAVRQFVDVLHQRCAQLLQSCEGQLHVGLHTRHLGGAEPRREL